MSVETLIIIHVTIGSALYFGAFEALSSTVEFLL